MRSSLRARFTMLFVALVLAPIALLSGVAIFASRSLAARSLAGSEQLLTRQAELEAIARVDDLARQQDRTFRGIERRARAMASQAELLFGAREACERSGLWQPSRLKAGGYGWTNDSGEPSTIWIPRTVPIEEAQRDLTVLAHVEKLLLAEPRGEGMTQWYIIHRSGVSVLVPVAELFPGEQDFDPRVTEFYLPATPEKNPSGRVLWTGAYNDPTGKGVMISCLAPIGKGADFQGVIGIDVNTADFREEVQEAGEAWEYAFLLDAQGNVLLVTPEGYADFGITAPSHTNIEVLNWRIDAIRDPALRNECASMIQREGGLGRLRIAGHDRLVVHRKLDSTGWTIGVVCDPATILSPIVTLKETQTALFRQFVFILVGLLLILVVGGLLFGVFLTRSVTRPVLALADAARRLGEGQPGTVIPSGGRDEIGGLADTLRQMVSDREEAQRAIAEAQKLAALGGLASGLCHELNNLLAPILGFAQVLGRGPLTAEQRAQVDRVEKAARSAREIVGSLLDSTHELAEVRHSTDLNAVLRDAVGQLEASIAAAHVEIVWDTPPTLPRTLANPALLQRSFYNVANNAVQALTGRPSPRRLTIRSRFMPAAGSAASDSGIRRDATRDHIRVTFDDTGPGIPLESLPRVFDPFFTTKPPGSGTGLGLSVATSCVRAHGGSLKVENLAPSGARFVFTLPVVAPPISTEPEPPVIPLPSPGSAKPRVLVVDDEDSIRILIRHALGSEIDIEEYDSGLKALEALRVRDFDAVLCDLRLRDIPGREVHAWLRANKPALAGRFIVMTGDTHGEGTNEFLQEFRTPCMTKPFDLEELRLLVLRIAHKTTPPSVGGAV